MEARQEVRRARVVQRVHGLPLVLSLLRFLWVRVVPPSQVAPVVLRLPSVLEAR